MLREGINGFCMALADSVPGVSGGTVAFIMGFYDNFIGSIHNLAFGKKEERKSAIIYLLKIAVGWIIGMASAVLVLSALFESHIYVVSSVFIGFILGAIPLIVKDEKDNFKQVKKGILFCLIGIVLVVVITWLNDRISSSSMDLGHFNIITAVKLFVIGMIAVSAMFLPGISGSTLLLIFGAYIPIITAFKRVLSLELNYLPCLIFFGLGMFTGAISVVKAIKTCLEKYRVQTVYMILGMMLGSLYAIIMGPTTLEVPQEALGFESFNIIAAILGIVLVLGMQLIKQKNDTIVEN